MKVFLTGGTGFIGNTLTQSLLKRGWDVVALVRDAHRAPSRRLEKMGARCLVGDVTNRESMREGMTGADLVVHNAAWYELGMHRNAQQLMRDINITGTENVLGLALELGIPRNVYVSSVVYYGDTGKEVRDETYSPQKPHNFWYAQTKKEAHEIAQRYQQSGLPLIITCPGHVVGPNDHSAFGYYLRMYLNHLMVPFAFSPEMMISPVHVRDVGEGIALAAEKGRIGETYILAGDPASSREIFEIWNTKPGGFKVRFYIPRWLAKALFVPLEPLQRLAGIQAFISRETVNATSTSYQFSSIKSQRELGWTYSPKKEIWEDTIDEELKLLERRKKRSWAFRLKPLEISE